MNPSVRLTLDEFDYERGNPLEDSLEEESIASSSPPRAVENRIVPNDDPDSEGIYKESIVMTATLSCDRRVFDGSAGAQWLATFKSHAGNPTTL
jgi:hypothetical protein